MDTSLYQVKVTNHGKNDLSDRFDGILYTFKAGDSKNLPIKAANHIFGTDFSEGRIDRDAIFKHIERRWGWNRSKANVDARKIFDDIEFSLRAMSLVETVVESTDLEQPREIETDRFAAPTSSGRPKGRPPKYRPDLEAEGETA